VYTLSVDVVAVALSSQQEHADVGRGTQVDEVQQPVLVRQSHYGRIHVLGASCRTRSHNNTLRQPENGRKIIIIIIIIIIINIHLYTATYGRTQTVAVYKLR